MLDQLTSSDIANEVSMMRSVFKGTVLIVEGVSDSRLYGKFTDRENVRIMIAHSKNNVMQAVSMLRDRRKDNAVLGIIDRDMDALLGKKRSPPLFQTDKRDLESTILASPALEAVIGAKVRDSENRIARVLYKMAVQQNAMTHVLATAYNWTPDELEKLYDTAEDDARGWNGTLDLRDFTYDEENE